MGAVRYSFDLEKACEHVNRFTEGSVVSIDTLEEWADKGLFNYKIEDGNYKITKDGIHAIQIYKNLIVDQQKTIEEAKAEFDNVLLRKEKEIKMDELNMNVTLDQESALISLMRDFNNAQIINMVEVEENIRKEMEKMKDEMTRTNNYYQTELEKRNREIEKKELELMYEKKYRKEYQEQLEDLVQSNVFRFLKLKKQYKK